MLTDTHIHLYSEEFAEDVHDLIAHARELGVERFFLPAIDAEYYPAMKALKEQYGDSIALMAGLHPTHVKDDVDYQLDVVEKELAQGYAIAVGRLALTYTGTLLRSKFSATPLNSKLNGPIN